MVPFPIILISLALLALLIRPFTILFHELGHAIPAILITKKPVSIYIGSYGDQRNSLHFKIGLLDVWFKYNPLYWLRGVCIPSEKEVSIKHQIIYTITGPLASITIALISCYFAFTYDLHGSIKLLLVIFLGSSIFDLFVNLTPNDSAIKLFNGELVYNDGYQLKQLFYYRQYLNDYSEGVKLFNDQKYSEASIKFIDLLNHGFQDESVFRLAIYSNIQIENYEQAKRLIDDFIDIGKMNCDDYSNAGFVYSQLCLQDKAILYYDKSLEIDSSNKNSLNNKGYSLFLIEKYEEAIYYFDKAIEIDIEFAFPYNNRGLSKIYIGKVEEGLEDIKHSLKLDKNNAYGYRNLGIYHLGINDCAKALELFNKAKSIDRTTHLIDEYINETIKKMHYKV